VVAAQAAGPDHETVRTAVARARSGDGPTLIEAKTLRIRGHYEGDRQKYRDDLVEGVEIPRDPLLLLRQHVSADEAGALDDAAREEAEATLQQALAAPRPGPEIVFEDVWA
jgi:pyruvate dehydrogenase E1 component alpha subunit